jgi:hypothetical protein
MTTEDTAHLRPPATVSRSVSARSSQQWSLQDVELDPTLYEARSLHPILTNPSPLPFVVFFFLIILCSPCRDDISDISFALDDFEKDQLAARTAIYALLCPDTTSRMRLFTQRPFMVGIIAYRS